MLECNGEACKEELFAAQQPYKLSQFLTNLPLIILFYFKVKNCVGACCNINTGHC